MEKQIKAVKKAYSDNPGSIQTAPIELKVPANRVIGCALERKTKMQFENWKLKRNEKGKVTNWYMDENGTRTGFWLFTPLRPDAAMLQKKLSKKTETVTLVPYECSKLQIMVFPKGS